MADLDNRRPIKSRASGWAQGMAAALGWAQVWPNAISALSVGFAFVGAALMVVAGTMDPVGRGVVLALAVATIQLRLACNLLDGMVAVEQGRGTATGPIWNELPDRIADLLFFVGAGYCAYSSDRDGGAWLGWACAFLAVLTAYVRELGRGLGFPADFSGPMAKPHRMAALSAVLLVAAFEPLWGWKGEVIVGGLALIAVGTAVTVIRRTVRLGRALKAQRRDEGGSE